MKYTNMNICLQCTLLLLACFILCSHGTRIITRFDRLEPCDQSGASPMTINYIHIWNPVNDNVRMSMNASINNYTGSIDFECNVQRYSSREALDTCIPFTKLKPINTCALLMMKNMPWSHIIESEEQFTCPVTRDAELIVDKVPFDMSVFTVFPLTNFYWKTSTTLYFGKEYISVCMDGRVIPKANHN